MSCDQLRVLLGRVLEVGVLDDDEVAGRPPRSPAAAPPPCPGCAPAGTAGTRAARWRPASIVARAVGRAVVDDDELLAHRHRQHAREDLLDGVLLVVDGHDDRQQRVRQHALQPATSALRPSAKPCGCAARHRQAVCTMSSSRRNRGRQPEFAPDPRARREQHRRVALAPRRRPSTARGRPLTRSTAAMTSFTENGRPLPRL